MKIRKTHAAWAVKGWVIISVFLVPFLGAVEVVAWLVVGGVLGLVWSRLPEEPEAPVEPLPFADQYRDRQIPRAPPAEPSPKGERE